jgi:polysaccharide export outer membrane protein
MNRLISLVFCMSAMALPAQTVGIAPSKWSEPSRIDSTAELIPLMAQTETSFPLEKYDLLDIKVYGADALSSRKRIAPDGSIDLPLAGRIMLAGLTVAEAEHAIAGLLVEKNLVITPAVTIDVVETPARVVTIDGEVARPGVYPIIGDSQLIIAGTAPSSGVRTLGQLIGLAGGIKDTASPVVTLIRPSLPGPVSISLGNDINHQPYASLPLFPGDTIRVAHVGQAYVIGAVAHQGPVPLKGYSPTTVAQAVSNAGGMGFQAAQNDGYIVRTEGDKRVVYTVKVQNIIKGKAPDVALQNDDILYIPTNQAKAALKSGAAGIIVSLASTYIYAHP